MLLDIMVLKLHVEYFSSLLKKNTHTQMIMMYEHGLLIGNMIVKFEKAL